MAGNIQILNFEKSFITENGEKRKVINDISIEMANGDFFMLVGANGSGKSTLFNAIAGSVMQDKGSIIVDGKNISHANQKERSKIIGRVLQDPRLGTAGNLTLIENLRLGFLRNQKISPFRKINSEFRKTASEKVALLNMGLEKSLDKRMDEFSGGQRQALSLIMCIMQQPQLLLMDEPTSALDPKSSKQLLEITKSLTKKLSLSVLMITHNYPDAIEYGNRLLVLKDGVVAKNYSEEEKLKISPIDLYQLI